MARAAARSSGRRSWTACSGFSQAWSYCARVGGHGLLEGGVGHQGAEAVVVGAAKGEVVVVRGDEQFDGAPGRRTAPPAGRPGHTARPAPRRRRWVATRALRKEKLDMGGARVARLYLHPVIPACF